MKKTTVDIVSDDDGVRHSIGDLIASIGLATQLFDSLKNYNDRQKQVAQEPGSGDSDGCLVIDTHDINLNEEHQRSMLAAICAERPVILITDCGDVSTAVRGVKLGAVDVVQKPYQHGRLLDLIRQMIEATP